MKSSHKSWLKKWFREKYRLAPNDPRFLEITYPEILEDLFETIAYHQYNKGEEEIDIEEEFGIKENLDLHADELDDEWNDFITKVQSGEFNA